jgi:hypothetical protein
MIDTLKAHFTKLSPNAMRQRLIDDALRQEISARKTVEDLRLEATHYESAARMYRDRIARLRIEMELP